MNRALNDKVISYRVREFDDQNYVIESYTMRLEDELSFYHDSNPNYYIRYNSYLTGRQQFRNFIWKKSQAIGYENTFANANNANDDIDAFNVFLATHYFPQKTSEYHNGDIMRLNALARSYIDSYNNSIRNATNINIDQQLSRVRSFLPIKIDRIECMNVGQANFSIGYDEADNKPLAVFDIGIRSNKFAVSNRHYAKNKLKQIDENGIVVISHYDYDHINGYRFIDKKSADRLWILPERRLSPTPAERNFLSKLNPHNCIFLKNIDYAKTPFDPTKHILTIGNIEIYQGNAEKIDPFQSTKENARCLMCLVKNERSILFSADCLYDEFPTTFSVDYFVIPHHCCFYGQTIKNIDISRIKEFIVFAGPNNRYQHPDLSHLTRLSPACCKHTLKHTIPLMNTGYYFCYGARIFCPPIKLSCPSHHISLR